MRSSGVFLASITGEVFKLGSIILKTLGVTSILGCAKYEFNNPTMALSSKQVLLLFDHTDGQPFPMPSGRPGVRPLQKPLIRS